LRCFITFTKFKSKKLLLIILVILIALTGVVSAETLTVYTTTANDAIVSREARYLTWSSVRNGAGVAVYGAATYGSVYLDTDTTANTYNVHYRTALIFNTSDIPDTATITSAKIGLYRYVAVVRTISDDTVNIANFTIDGSLDAADYDNFDWTAYSTGKALSTLSTTGYYNWSLNSAGIGNISKTGNSGFGVVFDSDITNTSPGWPSSGKINQFRFYSADYGSSKPFLEITYTTGDTTPPASITNLANVTTTCEQINFTWTNPVDADFNHTVTYWNTVFDGNLSNTTTNKLKTGLTPGTAYTLGTKTCDITGNCNTTWTNMTATSGCTPVASFTKDVTEGLQPLALQVNDTSTQTPTSWNWSWGDTTWTNTTTSSARNATKVYPSGGTYSVFLLAQNLNGTSQAASQTVNVYNQTSSVAITPSPAAGLSGTAIQLTPSGVNATKYNWFFPNGTSNLNATSAAINTFFASGGTYSVRLNVTDGGYGGTQVNATVNVYNQTTANFTPAASTVYIPPAQSVTFTYDGANATWYNWSFGNGTWYNTTSSAAIVGTYTTIGNNTVNLTTSNDGYGTSTAYGYVNVLQETTPPASITGLTYDNTTVCEQITWNWNNPTDADFNGTQYTLTGFGTHNLTNTSNWMLNGGLTWGNSYTLSIQTFDISGNMNTTWVNETAIASACGIAPATNFTVDNTSVCLGSPFQFNDTSTNTPTAWYWMFGDTGTSAVRNASYIYENTGTYNVFLNASNSYGFDWENKSSLVTVNDCTPPGTIVNLTGTQNCSQIVWDWEMPKDGDYNLTMIYQNGTFLYNLTSEETDTWTGLAELVEYTFSARTVDTSENLNETWVNLTKETTDCHTIPVANFTSNTTTACMYDDVMFNDTSTNTPDYWNWIFTGGWDSHYSNFTHAFDAIGFYNVSLEAGNDAGSNTTLKVNYIQIFDCLGPASVTNITGKQDCDEIEWTWDNPDDPDFNHTMIYRNDVFQYNLSNTTETVTWTSLLESTPYTISTHTVDVYGNMNSTWMNETVNTDACPTPPTAAFHADNTSVCENQDISFTDDSTNTPTNWDWFPWANETKFSDLQDPILNYSVTGTYSVRLYVSNADGNDWENKTNYITVNDCTPPDHIEKLAHTEDCFNITWTWIDPTDTDFDHVMIYQNGTWMHNITAGVETDAWVNLSQTLSYTISTRTVDTVGNIDTDWENHTVSTDTCIYPPVADFNGTPLDVCTGDNVTFTDLSTNSPTAWLWNFGDGTGNIAGQNQNHTFSNPGLFDVSLKVGNTAGDNTTQKVDYVNVSYCNVPPVASFTSNVTCGVGNFSVQFTDTSVGSNITGWWWDIGGVMNSTEQNPVINFTVTGMYGVDFRLNSTLGYSWSNKTDYITARALGDTCAGGGDEYDSDHYEGNWFTSWWRI
jgi:PKD repeat protein